IVETQGPVVRAFVFGGQSPGVDLDVIRGHWKKGADGNGHNIVDDQVGEDEQVTTGLRHLVGPFGAKTLDDFVLNGLQFSLFFLPKHRRPARNWAAPYRLALDHRLTIAPRFSPPT